MKETYKVCEETLNKGKARWDQEKSRFHCTQEHCSNLAQENNQGQLTPYCLSNGIISNFENPNFYQELSSKVGIYIERQKEF
jgi:hypothetical protein